MLRALRDAVWRRAHGCCEVRGCGRAVDRANWEAHVHHRVYRGHGQEQLADLELRCLACHTAAHPTRTFLTRVEQEARRAIRAAHWTDGLTPAERHALTRGAGTWAWRPP